MASRSFCTSALNFYPRPPRGGRLGCCGEVHAVNDFYPRPPRGGRHAEVGVHALAKGISIHALREEGDQAGCPAGRPRRYFYPRPPRGGRLPVYASERGHDSISIHALREEGDVASRTMPAKPLAISIHALREEGDGIRTSCWLTGAQFLSTPSARRATPRRQVLSHLRLISIHALREEGDFCRVR